MQELELWCLFGFGRQAALAKELNCSRQNIYNLIKSNSNRRDYLEQINRIEMREMQSCEKAKAILINAAQLLTHDNLLVRDRAAWELQVWGKVYSELHKGL